MDLVQAVSELLGISTAITLPTIRLFAVTILSMIIALTKRWFGLGIVALVVASGLILGTVETYDYPSNAMLLLTFFCFYQLLPFMYVVFYKPTVSILEPLSIAISTLITTYKMVPLIRITYGGTLLSKPFLEEMSEYFFELPTSQALYQTCMLMISGFCLFQMLIILLTRTKNIMLIIVLLALSLFLAIASFELCNRAVQ